MILGEASTAAKSAASAAVRNSAGSAASRSKNAAWFGLLAE